MGNKSKATNGEEALSSSIGIKKSKVTKASKILEALQTEKSLTQREIAQRVSCHEQYVSQVKRAENTAAPQIWYENHGHKAQEFDPSIPAFDRPIAYTSNLSLEVPLRGITEKEHSKHLMNIRENPPAKTQLLRRALFQESRKEFFHGFIEVESFMTEQDCKEFGDTFNMNFGGQALDCQRVGGCRLADQAEIVQVSVSVRLLTGLVVRVRAGLGWSASALAAAADLAANRVDAFAAGSLRFQVKFPS